MKLDNTIFKSNYFIITSKTEISDLINNLEISDQDTIIHLASSDNTILAQNLKSKLEIAIPHAQIILMKHNEHSKIYLSIYTLKNDIKTKNFNNNISNKLYIENIINKKIIKNYKNQLLNRYFIDHLTNLPNIYQLRKDLENNKNFSLIIFNIDNFRIINNFYGYLAGDYVIEKVGEFLKNNIKDHKVYRLSADEFALVINKGMFFYDLKEHLDSLYKQTKDIIIKYRDANIYIDITLASSVDSNNNIFSKVSMALKYAKEINAHFWIYEDKMDFENEYEKDISISEVIREAVNNFRIVPYYQAIVDTKTAEVKKYECLARLIDINGKIISPLDFIPITKKIKNYEIITRIIIDKSFATFESIEYEFTINLAIEDIINKDMFNFIMNKLKNSEASKRVTFEILESDAIEDFKKVERFITEVKRYGAKIAIDDFGSGYSNFGYLTRMNVDYIKIDGSLVKDIDINNNTFLIVEGIVEFAKKLGIKTIAEYVHSSVIMDMVKALDIDFSQGFYINKPSLLT